MSRALGTWVVQVMLFACSSASAQQTLPISPRSVSETLGYSKDARLLVIEAEDLGMAHSIDKASFKAIEEGWVTSAGILVPGPWFPEVLHWAGNHPNADLGIRLDLNSDWSSYRWRPVSALNRDSGIIDAGGYLSSSNAFVAQHARPEDVEGELRAQVEMAKRAGISITHLDNHMRTLLATPTMFQAYWKIGDEFGLPIIVPNQLVRARGLPSQKEGAYNFGGIDVEIRDFPVDRILEIMPGLADKDWLAAYEKTLDALPPGVYLLSVHLGYDDEELQAMTWDHPNWGAQWRQDDLDVVSNPLFQKFLKDKGFILVNWKDLKGAIPEH